VNALGVAAIVVVGGALVFGVYSYFVRRATEAVVTSKRTEEARVKVDEAKAKSQEQTAAKVQEVLHASPEDNLRRARELTRRGLQPK
jgi:23S rRNA maturation mini-RNase III